MYEKLMYKVNSRDNKLIYRLQDFTKNDNVKEDMFVEGVNANGEKRLECKVHVLHTEEFNTLQHKQTALKEHVEDLSRKIMKQNAEIKKLKGELAKYERADIDRDMQLQGEKFNILQEHTTETDKLKTEHLKAIDELNETHEKQLQDIDKTHKEELRKLRSHYTAKVDKLNEDKFELEKANNKARDNLRVEMLQLKQDHKDEVTALQDKHRHEVENIQHAHVDELQTLRKQQTYAVDELKQVNAEITQKHLVEVNEINQLHIHKIDEMRAKFLTLISTEHAQDLSDFNECGDLPFYVKPFARGFVKSFNEFKKRKELNTPKKIVETYQLADEKEKE